VAHSGKKNWNVASGSSRESRKRRKKLNKKTCKSWFDQVVQCAALRNANTVNVTGALVIALVSSPLVAILHLLQLPKIAALYTGMWYNQASHAKCITHSHVGGMPLTLKLVLCWLY
jgi:hypothetical protein